MDVISYRKKPVVIQAAKIDSNTVRLVAEWCGGKVIYDAKSCADGVRIATLEGNMDGSIGDYIIRGVAGEFYPCKPDIFTKTYEKV